MTIAPGPDSFGFSASLKPVDYDHGPALERSIKLLPDLLADGRQAKLCPWVSPLHISDCQGFGVLGVEPGEHVLTDQVGDFLAPVIELLPAYLESNSIERHLGWPLIMGQQIPKPSAELHRRIIGIGQLG